MNKLPKCAFPNCKNDGFILFKGRFICGNCLLKQQKDKEDNFWDKVDKNAD